MEPVDLERLVDHALKDLPAPRAPQTLFARVMTAVEQTAMRPWYSRAWTTWPRAWQMASTAAFAVFIAAVVHVWPMAEIVTGEAARQLHVGVPSGVSDLASRIDTTTAALSIAWRVMVQPLVVPALGFFCVMAAACMAGVTALNRVALGGASGT